MPMTFPHLRVIIYVSNFSFLFLAFAYVVFIYFLNFLLLLIIDGRIVFWAGWTQNLTFGPYNFHNQ